MVRRPVAKLIGFRRHIVRVELVSAKTVLDHQQSGRDALASNEKASWRPSPNC